MTTRPAWGWAVPALLLLAAGCGGGGGDAGDAVAVGQEAFESHCIACHGAGAAGTDAGPPLVHVIYEPSHHGDDAFRNAARTGVQPHHWDFGPMPPAPAITDPEIDAVIAYVRDLQRRAGIE